MILHVKVSRQKEKKKKRIKLYHFATLFFEKVECSSSIYLNLANSRTRQERIINRPSPMRENKRETWNKIFSFTTLFLKIQTEKLPW